MMRNVFRENTEDATPMCRANYRGCGQVAAVRTNCAVEGIPIDMCSSCMAHWRFLVQGNPALGTRCPLCAGLVSAPQTGRAGPAAAPPLTLRGAAAVAIREALRQEGITVDVRDRVLARLARDAPWLEHAELSALQAG